MSYKMFKLKYIYISRFRVLPDFTQECLECISHYLHHQSDMGVAAA